MTQPKVATQQKKCVFLKHAYPSPTDNIYFPYPLSIYTKFFLRSKSRPNNEANRFSHLEDPELTYPIAY